MERKSCIALLIRHLLDQIKQKKQANLFAQNPDSIFLLCPQLHTRMLSWLFVSNSQKQQIPLLTKELTNLSAFIFGPNQFDKNRTALHAAALRGNQAQLNTLVKSSILHEDIANNDLRKTFFNRYFKDNCFYRKGQNYQHLLTMALSKYPKHVRNQFQLFFDQIKRIANNVKQERPFDLLDIGQNTPLHLAAAKGHQQCSSLLSKPFSQKGFGCSTSRRNADGWRPRDYFLQYLVLNNSNQDGENIDLVPQLTALPFDMMLTMKSRVIEAQRRYTKSRKIKNHSDFSAIDSAKENISFPLNGSSLSRSRSFSAVQKQQSISQERLSVVQGTEMSQLNASKQPAFQAPILAIQVSKHKGMVVNALIRKLLDFKFNVLMFRPLSQPFSLYLLLSLQNSIVQKQAERLKILVRDKISLEFEPFTCLKRFQLQPFRSKDLQRITMQYLRNFVDFNMLTSQKALQNVILLHKIQQLKTIKDYWISRRWYKPAPFNLIRQLFVQGEQVNYPQFTALRNYFGEMRAFYYAWVSFYTSWLLIPVIPGTVIFLIRLFLFQDVAQEDQHLVEIFLPIFSFFMSIWGSLIVIRWQRKSSEIATKWGLINEIDNFTRQKRVEFNGDYTIDNVTNSIVSYAPNKTRCLLLLLSIPILLGLLALSVIIFIFLQNEKQKYEGDFIMQLLFGTINGISISIINLIYQAIANWSTDRQNYQHLDSYEKALVYKSFFFKFVNSNISLAYAAYATQQGFEQLWYLVVGLVLARMVSLFLLGNILPWIMFFIKKKKYFKTLSTIIRRRKAKLRGQVQSNKRLSSQKLLNKSDLKLMSKNSYIQTIRPQDYLPRVVYDVKTGKIQGDIPVDGIEMDARMNNAQLVIHRYSELMVQFGFITMFAAVSPISCLLALFANLLEIKYGIYFDSKYLQRNISHKSTGIGSWQAIWEFLTILSIVSNLLVSYFVFIRLRSQFSSYIWILILIQHVLVLIRSALIFAPSSKAKWVMHLISKKQFDDNQNKKLKEVLTQKKIQKLQKQLQKQEKANNSLMVNYKNLQDDQVRKKKIIEKQENEIEKLQLQIQYQSQQQQQGSRRMSIYASLGSPNISFQRRGSVKFPKRSMGNFLQVSKGQIRTQSDSDDDQQSEEHERAAVDLVKNQHILQQAYRYTRAQPGDITQLILQNIALQLLANTFTRIEKQYVTNRIGLISRFSSKSSPIILCQQCSKNQAFYLCRQCKDNFCQFCFTDIHYRSKLNHYRFPLSALTQQAYEQSKQQLKQQRSTFSRQRQNQSFNDNSFSDSRKGNRIAPTQTSFAYEQDKWIKMQQFSFPTNKETLYFKEIVSYFKFLIQEYIYKNFINQKRQNGRVLNLELFFLHRSRTALLSETMLQQIDYHLYEASKLDGSNFPNLNDEEKIFLNRIVYRLLQQSLISARYMFEDKIQDDLYEKKITMRLSSKRNPTLNEFLKDVKKLQNGTFEQKALFFAYLMDTNSNGIIKKSELKQFFNILMIQKITASLKVQNRKNSKKAKPDESLQALNQGSEQIVNLIFQSVNQGIGGNRSRSQIDKKQLVQLIINDQRIKRAMEVVLQQVSENSIFRDIFRQSLTNDKQLQQQLSQYQNNVGAIPEINRRQNLANSINPKVRFKQVLNLKQEKQTKQMARSYPSRFF